MITLCSYQGSGNGHKARLLLTQPGVPIQVEEIHIVAGEGGGAAHRSRHPQRKVPVVALDGGSHLAESNAILVQPSRGTTFWPEPTRLQDDVLQWLFLAENSREPNIATSRVWTTTLKAADRHPALLEDKHRRGHGALQTMEEHRQGREFLVCGRYTIADIALEGFTHVAAEGSFERDRCTGIRSWLARVADEPRHITLEHVC